VVRRNELRWYRRESLVSQQVETPEAAVQINPFLIPAFPRSVSALFSEYSTVAFRIFRTLLEHSHWAFRM
jgi:hypothetical protein